MRLLLVCTEFPPGPGGIGTHAWQIARGLDQLGWDVAVLTPQDYAAESEIQAFNRDQPFQIRRLQDVSGAPRKAIYRLKSLRQSIRDWQPLIVLASGGRASWLTAWATLRCSIPWASVGHGTEFAPCSSWERAITRWAYSRADGLVAVSNYSRRRLIELGIQPGFLKVIHNGADPSVFYPLKQDKIQRYKRSLNLPRAPILLTVGNVTERKGQDIVIQALPEVLREFPGTQYLVAGLPTLAMELRELSNRLGISDNVRFLGRVEPAELVLLYNACDVFVLTSRHTSSGDFEGYGIAVVEAALCGKPAVGTENSGLAEAMVDGQTGLLVPEDDPPSVAGAILTLLRSREMRGRLGEAARRRALKEQTWETRTAIYDAFLRQIIHQSTQSAGTGRKTRLASSPGVEPES